MKSLIFLVVVLQAFPLALSANPVGFPQRQQQNIAISPPSSVNSFSTSSDLESGSDSDNPSRKSSFFNAFKKLKSPSSDFRCYSYPDTNILSELSSYITNLVRSYRDNIFEGNGDEERKLFETCYAGYDATDVSPSIYFREMKAKQMNKVHQLLRNQVLTVFPNVKVVKTSNSLAIVWNDRPLLQRRVTV